MRTDLTVEIVVLIEKANGMNKVIYLSDFAANQAPLDLYVSDVNRHIALYHRQPVEADKQTARFDRSGLLYPGSSNEKMMYVGPLLGALDFEPDSHLEVSRAQLHLKNIPIDEMEGMMQPGGEGI